MTGTPRRVLVTGSRTWTNNSVIATALAPFRAPGVVLVHGAAAGADRIAGADAADWTRHGRGAGYHRNRHMVALGADACVAFIRQHSHGATHTADLAEQAGIPTTRYRQEA